VTSFCARARPETFLLTSISGLGMGRLMPWVGLLIIGVRLPLRIGSYGDNRDKIALSASLVCGLLLRRWSIGWIYFPSLRRRRLMAANWERRTEEVVRPVRAQHSRTTAS